MERYRRLSQLARVGIAVSLRPQCAHASSDGTAHTASWLREVEDAIQALPSREQSVILSLRDGYVLPEIACPLEVIPAQVSQIQKQVILRLRLALGAALAS
jgi:DNA-directed RNA polymerase specialized sigma subunit